MHADLVEDGEESAAAAGNDGLSDSEVEAVDGGAATSELPQDSQDSLELSQGS